jgi:hypothetical protein
MFRLQVLTESQRIEEHQEHIAVASDVADQSETSGTDRPQRDDQAGARGGGERGESRRLRREAHRLEYNHGRADGSEQQQQTREHNLFARSANTAAASLATVI